MDQTLEGFIDLGMEKDALALAATIIGSKRPQPREIELALQAIGVFSATLGPWCARVERMVARIPNRTRHRVRESLLMFFSAAGKNARAADFICKARRFSPEAFYCAVSTLVQLGRVEEAVELADSHPAHKRGLGDNDYLCEAFALAASAKGDHLIALLGRLDGPGDSPIACDLMQGAAESAFAMVIAHLGRRLQQLEAKKQAAVTDPVQISLPGLPLELVRDEEKFYAGLQKKLLSLIPKSRRSRYNFAPVDGHWGMPG